MKKYICLLILLLLSSCNNPKEELPVGDKPTTTFFHTFITAYVKAEAYTPTYSDQWISIQAVDKNSTWFVSPDRSGKADGSETAEFRRLSEQNGDTSYNREITYLVPPGRSCFAESFSKIDVVCTDYALDAEHPAGSSVNDLMRICYKSCAAYIRNNYTGEEWETIEKPLSELKEGDLAMIDNLLGLRFDERIRPVIHVKLEITLTTTEDKTYSVHASFRPVY